MENAVKHTCSISRIICFISRLSWLLLLLLSLLYHILPPWLSAVVLHMNVTFVEKKCSTIELQFSRNQSLFIIPMVDKVCPYDLFL